MAISDVDSLQGLLHQAQHALTESKALLALVQARVDSLLAVPPDTVVRVAERQFPSPVQVKLQGSVWPIIKDVLTLLLPIATYLLGVKTTRDTQDRKDAKDKLARRQTAARLTQRYLQTGDAILSSVADSIEKYRTLTPAKGGFFSAAYIINALDALSDFEEIKTRMIEFEDNDLEESIWLWNRATLDHLRAFLDVLQMDDEQLKAKHGEWQNRKLMFESQYAMVVRQASAAVRISKRLDPLLPPKQQASVAPAEPPGEAPR